MNMTSTTKLNSSQNCSAAGSTEQRNDSRLEDDCNDSEKGEGCFTLFKSRVTRFARNEGKDEWSSLGMGVLKVVYGKHILGEAIIVKNKNKEIISNTLISTDAVMQCVGNECMWFATDYEPQMKRTLKTVFRTETSAKKFYETFLVGYECAQIADIRDTFELKAIHSRDLQKTMPKPLLAMTVDDYYFLLDP